MQEPIGVNYTLKNVSVKMMNEDIIAKTNGDINNTIYNLKKIIDMLEIIRDELPMASFLHMTKIEQVNKMIEGLK